MGAESTITIDLNPYMKTELVAEHLRYISENEHEILALFGSLINKNRFNDLVSFRTKSRASATELLNLCNIVYVAPGNAANTRLPEQHIDFHTSCNVFEHIPASILVDILEEGNRIIKKRGLFVHRIDYSDHFSHSDKRISAINFLQYSDAEWAKYAGNRYMYMNRLRHDDFLTLFEIVGQKIVEAEVDTDHRSAQLLSANCLHLDSRFASKTQEILAITGSWISTEKIE